MSTDSPRDIRVLLVDGHPLLRAGLRALIDNGDGFCVVGESSDQVSTLALVHEVQPDVILLDLDFGLENVVDLLPKLRTTADATRVLILTAFQHDDVHRQAIQLGARGIVKKDKNAELLLKAIRKVHEGELWIERSLAADLIGGLTGGSVVKTRDLEASKIALLTTRENEVITLIAQGLKNKEIAQRLFLSEHTVRHHLTAIFSKLGVTDRLALAIYASRHGLGRPVR